MTRLYTPEAKELMSRHPLFKRLTGQVVWTLLEEAGLDPDAIDAFMSRFEKLRAETLDLLDELDNEGGALEITEHSTICASCESCAGLVGHCIPGDVPDPIRLMPPYGLGCRLTARHLQPATLLANTEARLLIDPDDLPGGGPLCSCAMEQDDLARWLLPDKNE